MGETDKTKEYAPATGAVSKKIVSRDAAIKTELMQLQRRFQAEQQTLGEATGKKRRDALHANLAEKSRLHNVKTVEVNKAAAERDALKKQADEASKVAIRLAQSVHAKTLNEAVKAFEAKRDLLEVAVAAQTKPLDESHAAEDAKIVAKAHEDAAALAETYKALTQPLLEELTAYAAEQAEKVKRFQERAATRKAEDERQAKALEDASLP